MKAGFIVFGWHSQSTNLDLYSFILLSNYAVRCVAVSHKILINVEKVKI